MKRPLALARLLAVAATLVYPTAALAAAGSLDPTFGHQGFVVFAGDPYSVNDIKVQSNGRILIGGDMGGLGGAIGGFAIVRLLPSGKPDGGFGSGGLATAPFGPRLNTANSLAIQSDGKIVAAGFAGLSGGDEVALARLKSNGVLDPLFGTRGTVSFAIPGSSSSIADVVMVLANHKLLVGGQAKFSSGTSGVVVRLKPNGSIDPTFGANGVATIASPFGVSALGVQSDGKIVALTGQTATRLLAGGSVDPLRARGTLVSEAHFGATMLTPDEKILTALPVHDSQSQNDIDTQAFRLFPNGKNDSSFASPLFDFINSDGDGFANEPFAIALQSDGSPIIAGEGQDEQTITEGALARLMPTGSLDPAFGNGGTVASTLDGDDAFSAVALQTDGKIIAAGISSTPTGGLVVARYVAQ
jgi:uncharacterized delta-60 repeat protein